MKDLLKSKSFSVGLLSIMGGAVILWLSPENKEIGIAMITSGAGTIALRDAIRKGK